MPLVIRCLLLCVLLWAALPLAGQVAALRAYAEAQYGSDDRLVRGRTYYLAHPGAMGHPFLMEEWTASRLEVADAVFEGVWLRYDLTTQELILRKTDAAGVQTWIVLSPTVVTAFELGAQRFLSLAGPAGSYAGQVYLGRDSLLICYRKTFLRQYSAVTPQGAYGDTEQRVYLLRDQVWLPIAGRRDLLACYAGRRAAIKTYWRQQRLHFDRLDAPHWRALLEYCEQE
ncbi:MAG: hypothetical protein OHK0039_30960 [Bacteroidia bacterium]